MKNLTLIALAFSAFALSSCSKEVRKDQNAKIEKFQAAQQENGINITEDFLKFNSGKYYNNDNTDLLKIDLDGSFHEQLTRQVGREENKLVPFPTVCSYVLEGSVSTVIERSAEEKDEYMHYASHVIYLNISKVLLQNKSKEDKACQEFLKEESKYVPMNIDYYAEVLSDNKIRLHNSGGGGFEKGEPRENTGTLDELFIKDDD